MLARRVRLQEAARRVSLCGRGRGPGRRNGGDQHPPSLPSAVALRFRLVSTAATSEPPSSSSSSASPLSSSSSTTTSSPSSSFPSSSSSSAGTATTAEHLTVKSSQARPNVAYVKLSPGLGNTAEALALRRALEKKYGRIDYMAFQKDFNIPTRYMDRVWVVFQDTAAWQRAKAETKTFFIPKVPIHAPGGPGLADVAPYAVQEDYDPHFKPIEDEVAGDHMMSVTMKVGNNTYVPWTEAPPPELRQPGRKHYLTNFVSWHGFSPIEPKAHERITPSQLFSPELDSDIDHPRMRYAVELSAYHAHIDNPLKLSKKGKELREKAAARLEEEEGAEDMLLMEDEDGEAIPVPPKLEDGVTVDYLPPSPKKTAASVETATQEAEEAEAPSPAVVEEPSAPREPTAEELEAQAAARDKLEKQLELARQIRTQLGPGQKKAKAKKDAGKKDAEKRKQQRAFAVIEQVVEETEVYETEIKKEETSSLMDRLKGLFR